MNYQTNLDDKQKELCAVTVMRTMLSDLCDDTGCAFRDAFSEFVSAGTYDALFDLSTGLWREGPDYLRDFFESMKRNANQGKISPEKNDPLRSIGELPV